MPDQYSTYMGTMYSSESHFLIRILYVSIRHLCGVEIRYFIVRASFIINVIDRLGNEALENKNIIVMVRMLYCFYMLCQSHTNRDFIRYSICTVLYI